MVGWHAFRLGKACFLLRVFKRVNVSSTRFPYFYVYEHAFAEPKACHPAGILSHDLLVAGDAVGKLEVAVVVVEFGFIQHSVFHI